MRIVRRQGKARKVDVDRSRGQMVVGSGMNDAEDADKRISGSLMADRRSRDSEGKVYRSNGGERYRQKEEEIKIVKQEEMVERIRCEGRQAGRQAGEKWYEQTKSTGEL